MADTKATAFFKPEGDNSNEEMRLMAPLFYMRGVQGRGRTTRIIQAFDSMFGVSAEEFAAFKEFMVPLLLSFLLCDDIADCSELRRGIPCAYLKYGINLTRRTTTYCIFLTTRAVLYLNRNLAETGLKVILQCSRGQGLEIHWRDNCICPTEEEYKKMAAIKTGSVFAFLCPMLNFVGKYKHQNDFNKLSHLLGTYFQIRDDHRNLISAEFTEEKGFCEDLSEGKFSFPVIHAIRTRPDDKRILNIVKQKPRDEETKKYCLSLLLEFGSIDYTYKVLEAVKDELKEELEKIPRSSSVVKMVDDTFASQLD